MIIKIPLIAQTQNKDKQKQSQGMLWKVLKKWHETKKKRHQHDYKEGYRCERQRKPEIHVIGIDKNRIKTFKDIEEENNLGVKI